MECWTQFKLHRGHLRCAPSSSSSIQSLKSPAHRWCACRAIPSRTLSFSESYRRTGYTITSMKVYSHADVELLHQALLQDGKLDTVLPTDGPAEPASEPGNAGSKRQRCVPQLCLLAAALVQSSVLRSAAAGRTHQTRPHQLRSLSADLTRQALSAQPASCCATACLAEHFLSPGLG